jgi:hypothetical protein
LRKSEVAVEVKNGFRFPWQKRTPVKIIPPYSKKYDGIRKGTLDTFSKSNSDDY